MALAHRHAWGLNPDVGRCVQWADDDTLIYACGHAVVLRTEHNQQFIAGSADGGEGFTALALSPSRLSIAVAEAADRATVKVYDVATRKRRKTLERPDTNAARFTSLCFGLNEDDLLGLASQATPPLLCAWSANSGKVKASTALVEPVAGAFYVDAQHSPLDRVVSCLASDGLRFARARATDTDEELRALPPCSENFEGTLRCHCWLTHAEHRTVAGTSSGKLLLYEACQYACPLEIEVEGAVTAVASLARGLVCGSSLGTAHVFGPGAQGSLATLFAPHFAVTVSTSPIVALSNRPDEGLSACVTKDRQCFSFPLADAAGATRPAPSLLVPAHFSGAITGLDLCARKPLVITCGEDKTVRTWNYVTRALELVKTFAEDPLSIAFHPSGLHCAIGFNDKLRLAHVLVDDLRVYKEINVKHCKDVRFSKGGQFFACCNSTTVSVYDFYDLTKLADLRGHSSKVKSLAFSDDDRTLVSGGTDGAVYVWDWLHGKRLGEFVQKGCQYLDVCVTQESVIALSSDSMLREFSRDMTPTKQLDGGCVLGHVLASSETLYVGTSTSGQPGHVRAYTNPLTGDFLEYASNGLQVTRLRLSRDGRILACAGADGSLLLFDVTEEAEKAERSGSQDKALGGLGWSRDVLATRTDLEERRFAVHEKRSKLEELQLHNEYQLRLKDMSSSEKLKEVGEKYQQDREAEATRYTLLIEEREEVSDECEERIGRMEDTHRHALQELENAYQQKIMLEVERYEQLEHEREISKKRWDSRQATLKETHALYVNELGEDFSTRLEADKAKRASLEKARATMEKEHAEARSQLDEDIDVEIQNLRGTYDSKLADEREASLRYKGENGIMRKKFTVIQQQLEDSGEEISKRTHTALDLKSTMRALEKEIAHEKQEITGRDDVIGLRERKIYNLKKKNQELEKFKFVLDYKIKELKRQIEPREAEISTMKGRVKEMDGELEKYHASNASLDQLIGTLRRKIDTTQKDILSSRRVIMTQQSLIKRFKAELHQCADDIQAPAKLKQGVTELYARHAPFVEANDGGGVDKNVQDEFVRLEENLKRMLGDLQASYRKDADDHAADNLRVMNSNMGLIREITRQRDANKRLRRQVATMEGQLVERARNPVRDPRVVARQHARARELQALVDHYASTLEAAGIHMPSDEAYGALPPAAPISA